MYQAFYRGMQHGLPLFALFFFLAAFSCAVAFAWGNRRLREEFDRAAALPLTDGGVQDEG